VWYLDSSWRDNSEIGPLLWQPLGTDNLNPPASASTSPIALMFLFFVYQRRKSVAGFRCASTPGPRKRPTAAVCGGFSRVQVR
jgi:hypothetical protein